ncbi:NUDIX hydrolase [Alexandriicola marinus]|uniref:NUDIX hydrolase n=1 Tax=Alexandriicola marinus TaxID=2081710 RepID=UPI001EED3AED|nr:NUDIX hydrolase [Alexandriicola marinus]
MRISPKSDFSTIVDETGTAMHLQLAALCLRKGKKEPEVLLVTSSAGRWILPKGWPMDGKKNSEAAMIEAWEEAGVRKAKVARKPVGSFMTTKERGPKSRPEPCLVKVFELKVSETKRDYPEADDRDRKWVSLSKAIKIVDDAGLRDFLKGYRKSL